MTGEQKPGGLRRARPGWLKRSLEECPAEPAEARIRELEQQVVLWKRATAAAQNADAEATARLLARATAAEAKLARAVEGLRFYADPHERPNEGPWGALSDDWGKRAAETLAALQQGTTGQ